MASVYTAAAAGSLTHVDFWTTSNNAQYQAYIYNGRFGSTLTTQTGTCAELGYYSIPLTNPVTLTAGQVFTVAVKMTTPGYGYPIPVERADSYSTPTIQSGVSFMRYLDSDSWTDLATSSRNAVCRVRVLATTDDPGTQKLIGAADTTATGNEDPNYLLLDKFTAEATGSLSQIKIKAGAAGNVKVAIYSDVSGSPGSLLSAVNTGTSVTTGWNNISITTTTITSGTAYWLALISDSYCMSYKSTGGTGRYKAVSYSSFTFPTTTSGLSSWTGYHLVQGWGSTGGDTAPIIGFSPSSFTFGANLGGSNPASQTLNISNTGGGTLSWSLSDDASWLTLSSSSGSGAGSSSLTVNIPGMSAGTYNGTITIAATGATNTPQTVPVTLTIAPPGGTLQKLVGANDTTATGNEDANYLLIDKFTAEATGSFSQIRVKCGASGNVKVAVYSDSSGSPGSLLSSVNTGTTVTVGWNQVNISPTQVVAGTAYWLAFISDSPCVSYNSTGGTGRYKAASYSGFTFSGTPSGLSSWAGYHLIAGWGSTTPMTPPQAPVIVAPGATVLFKWNAADTATNYGLQVSTTGDFQAGTFAFNNQSLGNVTQYEVTGLSLGTTYYWRVNASNSGGTSAWSQVRSITVQAQ
jgi:hypothetical protein